MAPFTHRPAGVPSRGPLFDIVLVAGSLLAATVATVLLGDVLHISGATVTYLLAVVAAGTLSGTPYAIVTSLGAFLITDFLFVEPRYTLSVASTEEWLHLLLFLVVAIVIGRLTSLMRERAQEAERRAAEAGAMFAMSRDIATATSALDAAPLVAARLASETGMARVWLAIGPSIGEERVVADTSPALARPSQASRTVLRTAPEEDEPGWIRVHGSVAVRSRQGDHAGLGLYRVPIAASGQTLGSIWATRERGGDLPDRSATRLLAAAADQFGQALRRDRLAAEATAAEVARESDALKTALLDSVSHDLRTPLAGIRAAAGNLLDPEGRLGPDDERELARSIDTEAQHLNALVRNVLDLSRIESGALRPAAELYELPDLVEQVVERLPEPELADRLEIDVPDDLPPVLVDATYLEQALANLLENAMRYSGGARIRVSARPEPAGSPGPRGGRVELTVEDGGPGVAPADLGRIFDKFYRGARTGGDGRSSRTGMGVGLAVVRGLVEAMGGTVEARRSELGGLAVVLLVPAAAPLEAQEVDSPPQGVAVPPRQPREDRRADVPDEPPPAAGPPPGSESPLAAPARITRSRR